VLATHPLPPLFEGKRGGGDEQSQKIFLITTIVHSTTNPCISEESFVSDIFRVGSIEWGASSLAFPLP
jgi:hypothetical protein